MNNMRQPVLISREANNDYVDVVIIGAGLSGIGAARHLQDKCPGKTYVVLEGRDSMGGTWDLFRYPGIRSDSDMYTLGYNFKPWRDGKSIADGPSILQYIRETAAEGNVEQHIRYGRRVRRAEWSTQDACWTVHAECSDTRETRSIRCNFILMCAGYYSYEQGFTPEFPGRERFRGRIVHPQEWPEDLDYRNKKVVVIGSGATAVTLIPEIARDAAHVVMVQRSPTYMVSRPDTDVIANLLKKVLPAKLAYTITRWKNIRFQLYVYRKTRTHPDKIRKKLLDMVRKEVGADYDVDTHFTPRYNPWDQRLCLVPNGDFFESINAGKSSIVTGQIETFTENGVRMQSGEELDADIIVTATGLSLVLLGGAELSVDGSPVRLSDTFSYLGMMYTDVPNLVTTFGYINASWTLRADLTAEYACRILNHLDETGSRQCTPRLRPADRNMPARSWITEFSSGYMQRVMHLFPKQGDRAPWLNTQNYGEDRKLLRTRAVDDGVLEFGNRAGEITEAASDYLASDAA